MSKPSVLELSLMSTSTVVTACLGIWTFHDRYKNGKFDRWLLVPFLACITIVLLCWVYIMPNLSYNPLSGVPGIVADFGYVAGVVTLLVGHEYFMGNND